MFVERLTEESVKSFLERKVIGSIIGLSIWNIKKESNEDGVVCWKVKCKQFYGDSSDFVYIVLSDFYINIPNVGISWNQKLEKKWIKYMYSMCGKDYKEAYIKELFGEE